MSNGHVIRNTSIAVDYWTPGKFVHFLTHCHADHLAKLKYNWWHPIYTSPFNAKWLENVVKISKFFLRPLNINKEHLIEDPYSKDMFSVTLINARHCPGSVMFYFQGSFGNILYTGDFRYDEQMHKDVILQIIIQNQDVNILYLDNTYASPKCTFPSRDEAVEEILDIIRKHPNSRIYLGLHLLGKEEILWNINKKLKEKVLVNEKRMRFLNTLQLQRNMITTKENESRIFVIDFNVLKPAWIEGRRKEGLDCIGIKPTALLTCLNSATCNVLIKSCSSTFYVVPYSDHSPSKELYNFVSDVKPDQLYPIINNTRHLGSEHKSKSLCKIPDFFYDLCNKQKIDKTIQLCESNQQSNQQHLCVQNTSMLQYSKCMPQKYKNKLRYRKCEISNRSMQKIQSHSVGLSSLTRTDDHVVHTKQQLYSHTQDTDFREHAGTCETEVISNAAFLEDGRGKLTRLNKSSMKRGNHFEDFNSPVADNIRNHSQRKLNLQIQDKSGTISHSHTYDSMPLNTVPKHLHTGKKPINRTALRYHIKPKMDVHAKQVYTSGSESGRHSKFSLLYVECDDDSDSSQNTGLVGCKTSDSVVGNVEHLRDEREGTIQNQKLNQESDKPADDEIVFLGAYSKVNINKSHRQNVSICTSNRSIPVESQKKKMKISKQIYL